MQNYDLLLQVVVFERDNPRLTDCVTAGHPPEAASVTSVDKSELEEAV